MTLKVEDRNIIKVNVNSMAHDGWSCRLRNGHTISLESRPDGIALLVDDVLQPVRWRVYRLTTDNLRPRNGGFIPAHKRFVYFVMGRNSKPYRHLYICG